MVEVQVYCGYGTSRKAGTFTLSTRLISCNCPECNGKAMTMAQFERHGGRGKNRNAKLSIRTVNPDAPLCKWLDSNQANGQQEEQEQPHGAAPPAPAVPPAAAAPAPAATEAEAAAPAPAAAASTPSQTDTRPSGAPLVGKQAAGQPSRLRALAKLVLRRMEPDERQAPPGRSSLPATQDRAASLPATDTAGRSGSARLAPSGVEAVGAPAIDFGSSSSEEEEAEEGQGAGRPAGARKQSTSMPPARTAATPPGANRLQSSSSSESSSSSSSSSSEEEEEGRGLPREHPTRVQPARAAAPPPGFVHNVVVHPAAPGDKEPTAAAAAVKRMPCRGAGSVKRAALARQAAQAARRVRLEDEKEEGREQAVEQRQQQQQQQRRQQQQQQQQRQQQQRQQQQQQQQKDEEEETEVQQQQQRQVEEETEAQQQPQDEEGDSELPQTQQLAVAGSSSAAEQRLQPALQPRGQAKKARHGEAPPLARPALCTLSKFKLLYDGAGVRRGADLCLCWSDPGVERRELLDNLQLSAEVSRLELVECDIGAASEAGLPVQVQLWLQPSGPSPMTAQLVIDYVDLL